MELKNCHRNSSESYLFTTFGSWHGADEMTVLPPPLSSARLGPVPLPRPTHFACPSEAPTLPVPLRRHAHPCCDLRAADLQFSSITLAWNFTPAGLTDSVSSADPKRDRAWPRRRRREALRPPHGWSSAGAADAPRGAELAAAADTRGAELGRGVRGRCRRAVSAELGRCRTLESRGRAARSPAPARPAAPLQEHLQVFN